MTEAQGVEAEPVTEAQETEVKTEVVEAEDTKENTDEGETEGESTEEQPELSVEEKLEKLERDVAGKQKKIDRQTAAYRKQQEALDRQKQEYEKVTSLLEQQQPDKEPVIDDFETHDEYVNALVDYKAKAQVQQEREQMMLQQQQVQQQQIMQERLSLRQQQEAEFMTENPLYKASAQEVDAFIQGINEAELPQGTTDAVLTQLYQGNVPEVIDYFGSNDGENLEELGEITRMTPPEAAVAIYKIQQKLSNAPAVKKETKPKTKPVDKPPKGNASGKKPLHKQDGKGVMDWVNS